MPVRSLTSSVLRWPDRAEVERALREWAQEQQRLHPDLIRLGYFGSYARGDWGVGSDLDLLAIVRRDAQPFDERARRWDLIALPVPAEILVYTEAEWEQMQRTGRRFARVLESEAVWVT